MSRKLLMNDLEVKPVIDNNILINKGMLYVTKGWTAVRVPIKKGSYRIELVKKGTFSTKVNVKDHKEEESNFSVLISSNEPFYTKTINYNVITDEVISFCSYGDLLFIKLLDYLDIKVYEI